MHQRRVADLLGAHVSTQGGVHDALARGKAIGATAIQVFTKTPNQWREPALVGRVPDGVPTRVRRSEIARIVAHDSYLINLATPDPVLAARSVESFTAELRRCDLLGIPAVVSHPGNFIDDREARLGRNAAAITRCLQAVPGEVMVLLETTAGLGHLARRARSRSWPRCGRRSARACATASPSAPTPATSIPPVTTWSATTTASGGAGSRPSASRSSAASTSTTPRRRSARAATGTS